MDTGFPLVKCRSANSNDFVMGEVTELVPVPDFKSAVSWLWSGKVSSILMLSRQFFIYISNVCIFLCPKNSPHILRI